MSLEGAKDLRGPKSNTLGKNDDTTTRKPSNNATTGATAGGARAILVRGVAFYFRAPAKAFFRTRVDYLAYARSINPRIQLGEYSWRTTTPGLLTHAIKTHGWRFVPNQLLPPLVANIAVGAILYTSYLQILGALHEPYSQSSKRIFPPPPPTATFTAGLAAGAIQSLAAAPLDALQVRFERRSKQDEKNKNMWVSGKSTLKELGLRGMFAGWPISLVKDSLGSAIFFSAFEYVKAQAFYSFVARYHRSLGPSDVVAATNTKRQQQQDGTTTRMIKPHYMLEPSFLLLAGIAASIAQQVVLFPLTKIQTIYHSDNSHPSKTNTNTNNTSKAPDIKPHPTYRQIYQHCKSLAYSSGLTLPSWLYRGFWPNSIRQTPATSAGLVIFELVRRRYGVMDEGDRVRILGNGAGADGEVLVLG